MVTGFKDFLLCKCNLIADKISPSSQNLQQRLNQYKNDVKQSSKHRMFVAKSQTKWLSTLFFRYH